MADGERLICRSEELAEGGAGVRFELPTRSPAFAIRYHGKVRAFVNRCPHAGTELDWQPGEFFEETGLYLICSTHGALFEPGTGFCVAGPCRGACLEPLATREWDGQVILLDEATRNHLSRIR
jgi:nitrite reductase/ring-hydroxylating ferredoxin subunit